MPVAKKLASIQAIGLSALSQLPKSSERSTNCSSNIETQKTLWFQREKRLWRADQKSPVQPIQTSNQGVSPRCTKAFLLHAHEILLEHKAAFEFRKCSAKSAVLRSSWDDLRVWRILEKRCKTSQIKSTYQLYSWYSWCLSNGITAIWSFPKFDTVLDESTEPDKTQKPALVDLRSRQISAQGTQVHTCMGHEDDEP